jgi:isocitrate dehydrogenase
VEFATKLEEAALETVEDGIMTGELIVVANPDPKNKNVSTDEFIAEVAEKFKKKFD